MKPSKVKSKKSLNRSRTQTWIGYCLVSTTHPNQTYVGITCNHKRRLRQHNGEIKGGAKYTRKYRPWKTAFCVYGLSSTHARKLEYAWKHDGKAMYQAKGYNGVKRRRKILEAILARPRWSDCVTEIK